MHYGADGAVQCGAAKMLRGGRFCGRNCRNSMKRSLPTSGREPKLGRKRSARGVEETGGRENSHIDEENVLRGQR